MPRSLVTGGAGFIGSHLVDHLVANGDHVVALDDLSTGSLDNLRDTLRHPRLRFVRGSVLDQETVTDLVRGVDRVFHLAAAVGVKRIVDHPLESLRTNLHGTETVLEAARKADIPLLLASTSEIYGKNTADRLTEDADRVYGSPLTGRWSYAAAKAIDESLAHCYWRTYGLPVVIARPFNIVGPRQTGRYGMVVPRFVRQALRGEDVTVYGDGHQTRCFCSVNDVVPAFVRLAEQPAAYGKAFNLGGGTEIAIGALAELVIALLRSDSRVVRVSYAEAYGDGYEDMRRRVPDTSRARELIGFEPRVGLEEVIQRVAVDMATADRGPVLAGSASGNP